MNLDEQIAHLMTALNLHADRCGANLTGEDCPDCEWRRAEITNLLQKKREENDS